jgi:hypothetical protein
VEGDDMNDDAEWLKGFIQAEISGMMGQAMGKQALDRALSAARDTALEEAAMKCERMRDDADGHSPMSASAYGVAAENVRALQSRPVSVLPVEKVLEVLVWAADLLTRQGYGFGIVRDIAQRLGVALAHALRARCRVRGEDRVRQVPPEGRDLRGLRP